METIGAAELLEIWERGQGAAPAGRALLLLAAAEPARPPAELAAGSVGARDAALLRLRERTFGPRLVSRVACPACGEALELDFAVADVLVEGGPPAAAEHTLALGGYSLTFRLPSGADLAALDPRADPAALRRELLARCVGEAREGEAVCDPRELPEAVADAVAARMAELDPQADVQLALACPACGAEWQALFDIASFLWAELEAWAARTLRDVDALARAYGWSEAAILALSPWRRRCYLELVAQ